MWRAILLAGIVAATPALAPAGKGFESGNDLFETCSNVGNPQVDRFCYGYIDGVADAMDGNTVNGYSACVPGDVSTRQVRDVVVQFLYRNAATRHLLAVGLVAAALQESFPCQNQ